MEFGVRNIIWTFFAEMSPDHRGSENIKREETQKFQVAQRTFPRICAFHCWSPSSALHWKKWITEGEEVRSIFSFDRRIYSWDFDPASCLKFKFNSIVFMYFLFLQAERVGEMYSDQSTKNSEI